MSCHVIHFGKTGYIAIWNRDGWNTKIRELTPTLRTSDAMRGVKIILCPEKMSNPCRYYLLHYALLRVNRQERYQANRFRCVILLTGMNFNVLYFYCFVALCNATCYQWKATMLCSDARKREAMEVFDWNQYAADRLCWELLWRWDARCVSSVQIE